jgi:hypothetical protein
LRPDARRIAIFMPVSTLFSGFPIASFQSPFLRADANGAGMMDMRSIHAVLLSTRARIGRRLAEIVAIAAASLPAVGA